MTSIARRSNRAKVLLFVGAVVAAGVLFIIDSPGSGPSGPPPAFAGSRPLEAATAQAAATGKPVLVFATASWCPPCRELKRGALSDPRVVEWVRTRTEPVCLDIDQDRDGARSLGITSIPTLVVLRGGSIVAVQRGAVPADELLAWLKSSTAE